MNDLTKSSLKTAVGLGSLAVTVQSAKLAKDSLKNPKPIKLIKGFTKLAIGTSLLVPISKIVNDI